MFFGEILSLFVAMSFTVTALFAEVGSKRMGSLPFNAVRMTMSLIFLALTLWLCTGMPVPRYADGSTWLWLFLSGLVGYVIGDYCLMKGYIIIGSRFGQLFMTLSAPTAAILGCFFIGEHIRPLAIVGMFVTLTGIVVSILSKGEKKDEDVSDVSASPARRLRLSLPLNGLVFAVMAGICQGAGLVLSKIGLESYDSSLAALGLDESMIPDDALLPVPLRVSVPFASTMIRGIMGLAGFLFALLCFSKNGTKQLRNAVCDGKAMRSAFFSMLFGPFIGVGLSLMATQYTATGIAQTIFALTPVLIILPSVLVFHQKVTLREVIGAVVSVVGVSLFFVG
ncbi:MAG: DMT family transporter [Bacteroidales bacterium]|nr:DMT family transporter [Bacteroidales bacterium]